MKMKNKFIIILIMMGILCLSSVMGYTQIEYSPDNVTWSQGSITNNNTITLEELGDGIKSDTLYYFRLRHVYSHNISDWVYTSYTTKSGGENMELFSNIQFLYLVVLILITIGFAFKDRTFAAISGLISMALGVWIITYGFGATNNWLTIGFGFVSIGIGAYLAIVPNLETINEYL